MAQPNVSTTIELLIALGGDPENGRIQGQNDDEIRSGRERQSDPSDDRDDQRVEDADDAQRPRNAPRMPSTRRPGRSSAAVRSPAAARVQPTSKLRDA